MSLRFARVASCFDMPDRTFPREQGVAIPPYRKYPESHQWARADSDGAIDGGKINQNACEA